MGKTVKIVAGALILTGAGIAGYFGYKAYKASKDPTVSGLGAFTDGGVPDYNAYVAAAYWKRQRDMYDERLRLGMLRGY